MKTLDVRYLTFSDNYPDLGLVSSELDKIGPGELIDSVNWKEFTYKPDVRFNIGYTHRELLLKYYVREECVKAEMTTPDQAVWEDSCVEFFVSPEDDGIYYNIETNPIGTCLMGAGTTRTDRSRQDISVIKKIRITGSMGSNPFKEKTGNIFWTITLAIPFQILGFMKQDSMKNKTFRANFYKCGDKLSTRHYLSWNKIETIKPDFHQPLYFGLIRFI
jgi:hypothetical protein